MTDEHPDRQGPPGSHTAAPLPVEQLYQSADLGGLEFETTADLAPLPGLTDQPRAFAAINFGTAINQRGFNIFVIGSSGARMQQSVKTLLGEAAQSRPLPPDWVYVNNFTLPHRPVALSLPGRRASHPRKGRAWSCRGFAGILACHLRKRKLSESSQQYRAIDSC